MAANLSMLGDVFNPTSATDYRFGSPPRDSSALVPLTKATHTKVRCTVPPAIVRRRERKCAPFG